MVCIWSWCACGGVRVWEVVDMVQSGYGNGVDVGVCASGVCGSGVCVKRMCRYVDNRHNSY